MILCKDISMHFGGKKLFDKVTLTMKTKHRYGLIGANGSGKSTLIKLIQGKEELTSGNIVMNKLLKVSALAQDQFQYENDRIIDVVIQGNKVLWEAIKEKNTLSNKSITTDEEGYRIAELESIICENDGYSAESNAEIILQGLGVDMMQLYEPLKKLSGGYKIRVLLAQCLFSNPDILLLDEPTNHLDILSTQWLEEFLKKKFKGLFVLISHDYDFLNSTCNNILDIDYNTITPYSGNYNYFIKEKASIAKQKEGEKASIEKKISKDKIFIEKFRSSAARSKQAISREKKVQKTDIPELRQSTRIAPKFLFKQKLQSGREVLDISELSQSFNENQLFQGLSFKINRGEKVAILGINGTGKSTLLKTILGLLHPSNGNVQWGHNTKYSYFSQDHHDVIKGAISAIDWLMNAANISNIGVIRGALAKMLLTQDQADKLVNVLSGGEAARVLFSKIILEEANVLVLDEPTNHLDLESRIALASALKSFEGTIVFVSHDRHFISTIADRIIFLHKGKTIDFSGKYLDFRKKYRKFFENSIDV